MSERGIYLKVDEVKIKRQYLIGGGNKFMNIPAMIGLNIKFRFHFSDIGDVLYIFICFSL